MRQVNFSADYTLCTLFFNPSINFKLINMGNIYCLFIN